MDDDDILGGDGGADGGTGDGGADGAAAAGTRRTC